jgi:hypothetical protein
MRFIYYYVKYRYAECHYAECRSAAVRCSIWLASGLNSQIMAQPNLKCHKTFVTMGPGLKSQGPRSQHMMTSRERVTVRGHPHRQVVVHFGGGRRPRNGRQ